MLIRKILGSALLGLALQAPLALANDHGGGEGGGGGAPMVFTVNLGATRYLQVGLIVEPATPEAGIQFNARKPRFQHRVLLLLGEQTQENLLTLPGKLKLQESIRDIANEIIDETPKTGIKEVLFSNFIIQ